MKKWLEDYWVPLVLSAFGVAIAVGLIAFVLIVFRADKDLQRYYQAQREHEEILWTAVATSRLDPEIAKSGLAEFDKIFSRLQANAGVWRTYPSFETQLRTQEVRDEPIELLQYLALNSLSGYIPEVEVMKRIRQLEGFINTMPTPDVYGPLVLEGIKTELASAHQ